jgi:hypothetical protein
MSDTLQQICYRTSIISSMTTLSMSNERWRLLMCSLHQGSGDRRESSILLSTPNWRNGRESSSHSSVRRYSVLFSILRGMKHHDTSKAGAIIFT